jgi:hypothetical protein
MGCAARALIRPSARGELGEAGMYGGANGAGRFSWGRWGLLHLVRYLGEVSDSDSASVPPYPPGRMVSYSISYIPV